MRQTIKRYCDTSLCVKYDWIDQFETPQIQPGSFAIVHSMNKLQSYPDPLRYIWNPFVKNRPE